MLYLVLGMLAGLGGHQADILLRRWENLGTARAWINMARSGIGIVISLPIYLLFRHDGERDRKAVIEDAGLYVLTFVSVGLGTALGYLFDDVRGA
ncbi:MAG: hypothetical protein KC418_23510 [Anaerolineales bacterium]|nr:hypothetical protein [Anaerolineales bacterium]